MMNRQYYYNYISEKIETLSQQIKTNGKLNLLDLNIHAESFFCPFLNHLYGYSLVSTNDSVSNAEAVDLVDKSNCVVIQVTSNTQKNKISSTLEKPVIKTYAEQRYTLKFLFIADEASRLRKQNFENTYEINFDPENDILDKVTILRDVSNCEIDILTSIYDHVKKELGEATSSGNIISNLAPILNMLAEKDLSYVDSSIILNEYNIDKKISFNDLKSIKSSTIDDKKQYYGVLDRIYKEFDKQGANKTLSVFSKLTSFYEQELLKTNFSNIEKFFNIVSSTIDYVKNSSNYTPIPDEELELCARIIVVDAFIRCKIFENPEAYNHVAS